MMRALMTKTLFVLSILLSAQALAFDVGGLSYYVINATDVEVTGRASGNTATDIVIPATVGSGTTYSVTSIGGYAFTGSGLTSVIIPDSVTIIGGFAFAYNDLTSVIIPDSVTIIGGFAFAYNDLTSVIIPDSVTTIGGGAFRNNALTSVTIGNSVTTIRGAAFRNNALTSVVIPDSVTAIEGYAFQDNALTSVVIPDSVTAIEGYAFQDNALTSVIIPDSVEYIGGYAFANNALTSVIIPDSVTTIGDRAFDNNVLTSVTIGNSVTTIEQQAFRSNALTSVIIPDSVTTIEQQAFRSNALTSAVFQGNFGDFQLDMFAYNADLATITYCEGTAGWPQGFSTGSTFIVTERVSCVPPTAPQITNTDYGDSKAYISVSVADSGSSPIISYNATCNDGTTDYTGTSTTSRITVSGLTNGVSYTCSVTATSAAGTSTPSTTSPPIVPAIQPADWIAVGGNVDFEGIPICALVLINGQRQFSCDGNGRYDMEVPVAASGMITVQVFADGFAPFNQIVTPDQAAAYPVAMAQDQGSRSLDVGATYVPSATEGRLIVSGNITIGSTPVCALVLANGQSMFSCGGSGQYSLDVPLDQDGNVTLMVFAAGFKPYKVIAD